MPDYTRLHSHHHDDYNEAKRQIHQQIGTFSQDDLDLFGRQVLVGVYVRPNITDKGFILSPREQKEDIWQGKSVLVLALGPDAFQGEPSYLKAMFGEIGAPKVGDWLFLSSASGHPISLVGDGGSRVKIKDPRGDDMDMFDWDGWPCRIVPDDQFIGRISKPHSVV